MPNKESKSICMMQEAGYIFLEKYNDGTLVFVSPDWENMFEFKKNWLEHPYSPSISAAVAKAYVQWLEEKTEKEENNAIF